MIDEQVCDVFIADEIEDTKLLLECSVHGITWRASTGDASSADAEHKVEVCPISEARRLQAELAEAKDEIEHLESRVYLAETERRESALLRGILDRLRELGGRTLIAELEALEGGDG